MRTYCKQMYESTDGLRSKTTLILVSDEWSDTKTHTHNVLRCSNQHILVVVFNFISIY